MHDVLVLGFYLVSSKEVWDASGNTLLNLCKLILLVIRMKRITRDISEVFTSKIQKSAPGTMPGADFCIGDFWEIKL